MAILNGAEFVNGYLVGKVFPPDAKNITENLPQIISQWDKIWNHIESNICFQITTPFTVTRPPDIPAPGVATPPLRASMTSGAGLSGTESILVNLLLDNGVPPDIKANALPNLIKLYTMLFNHIKANATVVISNINSTGTVASANPFTYSFVSITPVNGNIF